MLIFSYSHGLRSGLPTICATPAAMPTSNASRQTSTIESESSVSQFWGVDWKCIARASILLGFSLVDCPCEALPAPIVRCSHLEPQLDKDLIQRNLAQAGVAFGQTTHRQFVVVFDELLTVEFFDLGGGHG